MGYPNKIKPILELVCGLYFGRYGMFPMILPSTRKLPIIFTGYSFSNPLDPYVVLSPTGVAALGYRF
jgi:hypothetical protein